MSEDNDWDKVAEEFDCILDASIAIPDNRKTSTTNSSPPSVQADSNKSTNDNPNPKTFNRSPSETVSLATVSLMDSTKDQQMDDLTTEQGDDEASLLPSPQSQPLQIVSVGNETDEYAFTFHEKSLNSVLRKVPPGMKVSVVSVVGAFRTGKSFLLSWFLRYLHLNGRGEFGDDDVDVDNDDAQDAKKWYDTLDSLGNDGFDWRGGADRNTTGIWMWSTPHVLPRKNDDGTKEDIAVLLVDTQGMFDHETTMGLTAAIFGLSTLLSSYQIYNVDKRIQEDNLQQLAMFSEYGRMALNQDFDTVDQNDNQNQNQNDDVPKSIPEDAEEEPKPDTSNTTKQKSNDVTSTQETDIDPDTKPFQNMEFLVRDWQNFEDDDDLPACEAEMEDYLKNVLAERAGSDLKATREQIQSCFRSISCYLMVHPGFGVTKKRYTGDVKVVNPTFLAFLDRYCRRVFSSPVAKSIHGRELTAGELGAYIRNYAKLFASGAHFPEASTMLEATANANNTNATEISMKKYKEEMDHMAGIRCTHYIQPSELQESHRSLYEQSESLFDEMANFGNMKGIEKAKIKMVEGINESFDLYNKLNESRNPLAGFETFIIPLTIGFISIALRWIADSTCSSWSQTCRAGSDVFSHIYQVVFFFLLIVSFTKAKQIAIVAGRVKKACDVIIGGGITDDVSKE